MTSQGGAWHAATVRRIAMREAMRDDEIDRIEMGA